MKVYKVVKKARFKRDVVTEYVNVEAATEAYLEALEQGERVLFEVVERPVESVRVNKELKT